MSLQIVNHINVISLCYMFRSIFDKTYLINIYTELMLTTFIYNFIKLISICYCTPGLDIIYTLVSGVIYIKYFYSEKKKCIIYPSF